MQLESSVTLFDDNKVENRFAELQITADGITSEVSKKVGNDEVISRINQSAEGIQIQANKVNIEGATIFSSGRLSQSSLNSAYDANGSATSAVSNLKADMSSASGTTVINGGHIATGTLSAGAVNANSGTFNTANIPNLSANKITADTINIARIPATARNDTYITDIGSDGIRVHDSRTSSNSIVINSSGMEVFKGGTGSANSVAFYGDTARIGKRSDSRIDISSTSVDIYKGTTKAATISANSAGTGEFTVLDGTDVNRSALITPYEISMNGTAADQNLLLKPYLLRFGTTSDGVSINASQNGLSIDNSSFNASLDTSGPIYAGTRFISQYSYNNTISTDNRVAITSSGTMGRYKSSSKRYKEQIEDSSFDPHGLYKLKARQFKYKDGYFSEDDDNPHAYDIQVGFIAEEVDECYPAAAVYDTNTDEVESWSERSIIPAMLTLIQEQHAQIIALTKRVEQLETKRGK